MCSLKGIRIGRSVFLSHLLFVNDILLFCDGSRRDAMKLKEILDLYCTATGKFMNLRKSTISFLGINEDGISIS
jgi:hypothetical protein